MTRKTITNMTGNNSFYFTAFLKDSDTSWGQDRQLSGLHLFSGLSIPTAKLFHYWDEKPASCVRGSSSSCDTVGLLPHNGWVAPDCDSIAIWVTWTCWGRTISSRKKPSSSCLYLQQVNWFIVFNHAILDWKQLLLLMIERVWFLLSWK
jgi:hypothetical protein